MKSLSPDENYPEQRYEIGYRLDDDEFSFMEMAQDFQPFIDTVYFPWIDSPSGRAALGNRRGNIEWEAQQRLEEDLRQLKNMGIHLNLLLNANCYGPLSTSTYLRNYVYSILKHLAAIGAEADIVTTCSPFIAEMVKEGFPSMLVRASVNMRIGTVEGMAYLAHLFDEYNIQREYNRDLARLTELRQWADKNGKGLYLLANSGCFNFCSSQTFHDNLVAHEKEICEIDNPAGWAIPNCRRLLQKKENWKYILQGSWIRPEDIHQYSGMFPVIKLATRMHPNPGIILDAYVNQSYAAALTDLTEPGFSRELAPYMLINRLFPAEWFEKTTRCSKQCHRCGYCESILDQLLVDTRMHTAPMV
ncbi:peptidase U32 [Spirochaetia bacterium]|nr:peptidase U32 [Spirochaetia bacterium]